MKHNEFSPILFPPLNELASCEISFDFFYIFLFTDKVNFHSLCQTTFPFACHCLIKRRCATQEHAHSGWMKELLRRDFIRFERLAWVEERRYACQRNVQHSTNTLNAPRDLRQRIPPGFSLSASLALSLAFLLLPPVSLLLIWLW